MHTDVRPRVKALDRARLAWRTTPQDAELSPAQRAMRMTGPILQQAFEAMSFGVVLVDEYGEAGFASARAQRLIAETRLLELAGGRLSGISQRTQACLQRALQACIHALPDTSPHIAIALRDRADNGLVLALQRIDLGGPQAGSNLLAPAAVAAIYLQASGAPTPALCRAFATRWGLTECEMGLVELLGQGMTTAAAARHLEITRATVKTHLRNIFDKTGTSRQVELVRLLLTSLPPVRI